jgi:uncharacterized DUF497 family protein
MDRGVTFQWDEAKRRSNLAKHGVDFAEAENLEWDTALVAEDDRRDYGEDRFIAFAKLGNRLHCIAFTRRGNAVRVISFRKAHWKEKRFYDQKSG